jgi:hypothetical protein
MSHEQATRIRKWDASHHLDAQRERAEEAARTATVAVSR